jgi:hypothetical protein
LLTSSVCASSVHHASISGRSTGGCAPVRQQLYSSSIKGIYRTSTWCVNTSYAPKWRSTWFSQKFSNVFVQSDDLQEDKPHKQGLNTCRLLRGKYRRSLLFPFWIKYLDYIMWHIMRGIAHTEVPRKVYVSERSKVQKKQKKQRNDFFLDIVLKSLYIRYSNCY